MIELIIIIIRQYLFCYIGSFTRFILDKFLDIFRKNKKGRDLKQYRNYKLNPDTEFLDTLLGFIIFGLIITFIVRHIQINS